MSAAGCTPVSAAGRTAGSAGAGSSVGEARGSRAEVLRRATPPARRAAPALLLGILADACVVGLLGLSMWLIVKAGEQPPILHLTFAIVGVRALAVGRAGFRYAERLAGHDATLRQLAGLRVETYAALVPRVPGAIEGSRRGEVLSTFVDDVDQLQDQPLRVRQPLVVSLVVVALSVIAVGIASPLAAVILAGLLAVSGFLAARIADRVAGASDRELADARSALTDVLLERFASAQVLAAFGALPMQRERIRAAEERLARVQLARTRAAGSTAAVLSLAAGLVSLAVLLVAAPDGWLSAPLFAAVVVVPAAVFEVFAQVFAALAARRVVSASADRIARLTESELPAEIPVDPEQPADPAAAASAAPILEARGLSARHPGAEAPAISGLSFSVRPGELLLVTGESGAGKSTLALVLARFLEYEGSYRVRGVEARELRGADVRATVGLCEQQPHLFDSDLRQNLKFARDTASDGELLAVLDRVGLGAWTAARGGLDEPVGEHGALVSGGQAQRIALARAILADFPLVILDEPTAGVDRALADRLLTDLLGAIPAERAVILITHTELPSGVPVSARLAL